MIQIPIVAVLHNYVECIIFNERLPVSDNEGMYQFAHDSRLIDGLNTIFGTLFLAF